MRDFKDLIKKWFLFKAKEEQTSIQIISETRTPQVFIYFFWFPAVQMNQLNFMCFRTLPLAAALYLRSDSSI